MDPLLIVNPSAASGRAGRTFAQVLAVIERRLGSLDVAVTERPGHATSLAYAGALDGRSLIIAVGGDGTLHEVANGVLDGGGRAALGYVGQGTGGDFRRTLDIPHRLDAYVEALASGRERAVDVGRATFRGPDGATRVRWFVNILSMGMGGLVDRYVATTTKAFGSKAAYFWASTRALASVRRARLHCTVSLGDERGDRQLDAFVLGVCNGGYFGGGMRLAPMAEPDDGLFDVVVMNAPSKLAFAAYSSRIYGGRHMSARGVSHFRCDRIKVELQDESLSDAFLLDVDGEPLGALPVEIELVPRALRVLV